MSLFNLFIIFLHSITPILCQCSFQLLLLFVNIILNKQVASNNIGNWILWKMPGSTTRKN
jgi:hypothetical protein